MNRQADPRPLRHHWQPTRITPERVVGWSSWAWTNHTIAGVQAISLARYAIFANPLSNAPTSASISASPIAVESVAVQVLIIMNPSPKRWSSSTFS